MKINSCQRMLGKGWSHFFPLNMSTKMLCQSYHPRLGQSTHWRQKNTPVITSPVATMPQRSHSAGMRRATRAPM